MALPPMFRLKYNPNCILFKVTVMQVTLMLNILCLDFRATWVSYVTQMPRRPLNHQINK